MSGIAGAIDLMGQRLLPPDVLHAMAAASAHRGPDGAGYASSAGVSLACRRLAVTGVADGQPLSTNEDGNIEVACHGALFDYADSRARLEQRGHVFHTHADGELLAHLWEEYGDQLFEHLRGQFAFVLHDRRQRRVVLARDRFGICPLHWARHDGWLYFGSEVKAILAAGVPAVVEPRGLNHVFTFFALPGPLTCFQGIEALLPGHYLDVRAGEPGERSVHERTYWRLDFPDQGDEDTTTPLASLVDQFEDVMLRAVRRRLQADVPVAAYLSGGIDSGLIVAMATRLRGGTPPPTFTIQVRDPALDETARAFLVGKHLGAVPQVVGCGAADVLAVYPRLVAAAESPVIDTACAGLLLIADELQRCGYKTALTGEGADEWLASYPWYKVHKLLGALDFIPGVSLSSWVRQAFLRVTGAPRFPAEVLERIRALVGGHNGWLDAYGVMSMAKLHFYGPAMRQVQADNQPYADLQLDRERLLRWHPLHRALYLGARVHLPGLLLHSKGDRASMQAGVENRYAFLDEDVVAFLARLHPRWKLRGLTEKYLLRHLAQRWLPHSIAWRRKALFRAPFDCFHVAPLPPFVEQLYSPESLHRTGYFDATAVQHWRRAFTSLRAGSMQRQCIEMGLAGVLSTQLWHHLYIDPTLCELPGRRPETAAVPV